MKILKSKNEPTNIELLPEQSAIVLNPDGSIEAAYLPGFDGQQEADEGMLMIATILFTAKDPDLRKIIRDKFEELDGNE